MFGKTRLRLLGVFFSNTSAEFYTGEIGRILVRKPGTFQRQLDGMAKEGILESEYRGNLRYFHLNKNYPFYDELKSIVSKTTGVEASVKEAFAGTPGVKYAFIYGSVASGREHEMSDIDILMAGKPDEDEVVKKADWLEKRLKRAVNYKLLTMDSLKKHIKEKDPFITNVLRGAIIMIEGDENELRKDVEGKPRKKTGS